MSAIANFIGSSIGNTAAYAQHGATRLAVGTGRFGTDLVAATASSYASKADELAARRAAIARTRTQAIQMPVQPANVAPRVAAKRKVAAA